MAEWNNYVNSIFDFLKNGVGSKQDIPFQDEGPVFKKYFPNHCHVCHCLDNQEHRLKRCSRCQLVLYCGRDHQAQDWKQHKELCKALTELGGPKLFEALKNLQDPPNASLYKKMTLAAKRTSLKNVYLSQLTTKLNRKPFVYEMQMINYPRICAICFENNPSLLVSCTNCPQSSFCIKHKNDPSHLKICAQLKLASEIELDNRGEEIFKEKVKKIVFTCQENDVSLPSSMKDFLLNDSYIQVNEENVEKSLLSFDLFNAYLSEVICEPLTVIYAIKKLNLQIHASLKLHIIGAIRKEVTSFVWELILHWLPDVTDLTISFFGPDIKKTGSSYADLCENCKLKNANLVMKFYKKLYQDYNVLEEETKPHIVAAFNAGIHAYESWMPALKIVFNLKKPYIQTSYTESEAYKDHMFINSYMPNVKYRTLEPNPFASFIYERNADDETVFSGNKYLTIYDTL